jgi:hypothetical protein
MRLKAVEEMMGKTRSVYRLTAADKLDQDEIDHPPKIEADEPSEPIPMVMPDMEIGSFIVLTPLAPFQDRVADRKYTLELTDEGNLKITRTK